MTSDTGWRTHLAKVMRRLFVYKYLVLSQSESQAQVLKTDTD